MAAPSPVFIVGTGRCGSTMLSTFLRQHPDVLSVSEFLTCLADLGGRIARCFPDDPLHGAAFWRLLSEAPPKLSTMLRHGVPMEEVLYRASSTTRFTPDEGVPAFLQTTLPHLSNDAEQLFYAIEPFVTARRLAPIGQHYQALFQWLAEREGKSSWVERSGGSLRIVARLLRWFPDARFVHIVRDGRDCAISMSRHYGFRMALVSMALTEILGCDPYESSDRTWEGDIPEELIDFLPERFDPGAFENYQTPIPLCGHYWSGEIITGLNELAGVGSSGRLLTLRYEDFLQAPQRTLGAFAEFLELRDEGWTARVLESIRRPCSRVADLSAKERHELEQACAPGFAALDAAGFGWG
jgi:hypothetical protein